jgi:hypothetical protein
VIFEVKMDIPTYMSDDPFKRRAMDKGRKQRAFGSRSLLFSSVAFFALSLNTAGVEAGTSLQSFSADVIHIAGKQTSTGEIHATKNAVRTEGAENGQEIITIVRLDRNELHILAPAAATNLEMPYIDDAGGNEQEFAQYIEGAETQSTPLGTGQIGPYRCDKSRVQVTYQGHVYESIEWAAKELDGLVVKRENEKEGWSTEYSDVRLGPQDPSLFEIPPAYRTIRYSKNWMMFFRQTMLWGSDPSKLVSVARAAGLKLVGDDPTLFTPSHSLDDYSFELVDPITGAEVYSAHTIVDRFPPRESASKSKPAANPRQVEPKVLAVQRSDSGREYSLDVSFVVPDVPNSTFDTITVYGMQIMGTQRSHDRNYPSVYGHWQPNDHVEFSVRVPKEYADPSKGWNLTFCVGSAPSCYPSANLLTLIPENSK